jgi:hypothetical protein
MSENLNHECSICGQKYHFCIDCGNAKTFTPWRTIVDTIEHYKIFIIIRDYVNGYISKDEAKKQMSERDLTELDSFVLEIKDKINEILREDTVISRNTESNYINKKKR